MDLFVYTYRNIKLHSQLTVKHLRKHSSVGKPVHIDFISSHMHLPLALPECNYLPNKDIVVVN